MNTSTLKQGVTASIIVPCYNEENTIQLMLEAICKQDFPISEIEVVISDAMSTDQTRKKIQEFSNFHKQLRILVVDNPSRTIPAGVNTAAMAASGEILIRMDAHSVPSPAYVQLCIDLLRKNVADNVGGIWKIKPGDNTCIAKAIAKAASHLLGAGDAKYRVTSNAQYVDTVPFGTFFKDRFVKIGMLNEALLANEDYEFNARLIADGGKIWLDPKIQSIYYARKDLLALSKQYWRYGFWKYKMLRIFPNTLRWRQAIPPVFVSVTILLSMFSIFSPQCRFLLGVGLSFYLLVLFLAGLYETIHEEEKCFILMPFAIITMHFSWGLGFIYSFIKKTKS